MKWFDASIAGQKNSQPCKAAPEEIWTAWVKFSKLLNEHNAQSDAVLRATPVSFNVRHKMERKNNGTG